MAELEGRNFSQAAKRRPPVPCPRLPPSLHSNKQTKMTDTYSYAEVEFRPMIITEDGALAGPVDDEAPQDGNDDSNPASDDFHWDDDIGVYNETEPYVEGGFNPARGIDPSVYRHYNKSYEIANPPRETVIGADSWDDIVSTEGPLQRTVDDVVPDEDSDEGYRETDDIYDTPIDTSTQGGTDAAQLYSVVDFSQIKKNRNRNMNANSLPVGDKTKDVMDVRQHQERTVTPELPARRTEEYDDYYEIDPTVPSMAQENTDLSQLYSVVDLNQIKKNRQRNTNENRISDNKLTPTNPADMYSVVDLSQVKQNKSRSGAENEKRSFKGKKNAGKSDSGKAEKKDARKGSVDVGKSKFFVDIPDRRDESPPPMPKPYAARKKSAPELFIQRDLPPLPPKINELKQKQFHSSENLYDPYETIQEPKRPPKGHRRNKSDDLRITGQASSAAELSNPPSKTAAFKALKKNLRKMKSHETVTAIFSPSPTEERSDDRREATDERQSTESGKSSAESSFGDSASVSKESQDSGENLYSDVDMKDILQKAEALVSDELPEGWQEVRDGNEIYYWHIWTGTIQYERPVLSATPSSSSRSLSPSFSDPNSSQSPNVSEQDKALQNKSPEARPESPHEKPKQAISFPVHSMGWIDVEPDKMGSDVLPEAVNECISSLAEQRKDLWAISETWGEGKDIKLILEGESLKLVEPKTKTVLLVQRIVKMRVWGVGKEDQRDFAYIARDKKTGKHRCHMFRCHGNVSGRSVANTLQVICKRIIEEKRKAQEKTAKPQKQASDLLNAPVSSTARGNTAFNEKPYFEQKKCFSAKYIGWTEVTKSSGIDTLNKAVAKLCEIREPSEWKTVLLEITTSEVKTIDCSKWFLRANMSLSRQKEDISKHLPLASYLFDMGTDLENQDVLMEDRVRFISFLGVAKDERMCGYIVAVGMETFVCHVFCCTPHAGTLTRAIEEACKLRYEKFLFKNTDENIAKPQEAEPEVEQPQRKTSLKEGKSNAIKSSMQGLFSKLQKKDSKKKVDDAAPSNMDRKSPPLQAAPNEYLVKYFGCVEVELGTGIETVQKSVEQLSGGAMMIGYLEITKGGLTLCDSQRTALSRRVIDLDTVSYCGITGDKRHFGLIVSQGRGKYACHVCEEYKTPVGNIVSAIHDML